MRIALKEKYLG